MGSSGPGWSLGEGGVASTSQQLSLVNISDIERERGERHTNCIQTVVCSNYQARKPKVSFSSPVYKTLPIKVRFCLYLNTTQPSIGPMADQANMKTEILMVKVPMSSWLIICIV